MDRDSKASKVRAIMLEFADQTGISNSTKPPRRYLWTDAFAVCNFLTLYRQTGNEEFQALALRLIDQVHTVLGKHRADDTREGWISGLSEQEGRRHPTAGGLRIGKKLNERAAADPFDERLEWERDGQYFHYLTKWMHALERAAAVTGDSRFWRWSVELAEAAYAGFAYRAPTGGARGLHWKMSIDLSRPLVPSMGLHDALDGFVTYNEVRICAQDRSDTSAVADLSAEITDMAMLCRGQTWETIDPLGIGGLLFDACRVSQMIAAGQLQAHGLLEILLRSSHYGLEAHVGQNPLDIPAGYRLAFRELGLSIGLKAVAEMRDLLKGHPGLFEDGPSQQIGGLMRYVPLAGTIESFWEAPANQQTNSWIDHRDINMVMLATSLLPDQFLLI